MQSSRLKQLQTTFARLKRAPLEALPTGCRSIDLLDEDDITQWFVQLHYENEQESTTVSLKLHFQIDEPSFRMPHVYVIQPRLMASFIHHGAVCSLELMSQDWSLSMDSVQLLIACLHATLDVYRSDNKVTIDLVRASYSSGEHENGMHHIRSVHAKLFRKATSATTATTADGGAAVSVLANAEVPSSSAAVRRQGSNTDANDIPLAPPAPPSTRAPPVELTLDAKRSQSPRMVAPSTSLSGGATATTTESLSTTVFVSTEDELLKAIEHHQLLPGTARHNGGTGSMADPAATTAAVSAVSNRLVVMLQRSITVTSQDAVQFRSGSLTFVDAARGITPTSQRQRIDEHEASLSPPTADGQEGARATLRFDCSDFTVGPDAVVAFDGIRVAVGPRATLHVLGTLVLTFVRFTGGVIVAEERGSVKCALSRIAVRCAAAEQEGLAVLDNATMQLTNCLAERLDADETPVIRSMALVSNQAVLRILEGSRLVPLCVEKTILVEQGASILIADSTVVAGISCAVGVQGCAGSFLNTVFEGACSGIALQVDDSSRPTGLNAELGAKVDAIGCTARNLYFGFSTIASSVASFSSCCAANVVNGFTVDASTASLDHCASDANHVGLFVLHRAKCTVTSSRWDDGMTMDKLEALVRSRLADPSTGPDDGDNDNDDRSRRENESEVVRRCGKLVAEHRDFPCTVFSGGLFGIEVRNASVSVSCAALLNVQDTALYVYDEGDATVKGLLALTSATSVVSSQGCGVKLFSASATLQGCFTSGFPFGFAAIQCTGTPIVFEECFALGGTNGFTVDTTKRAVLRRCGAETDHVALFALNDAGVLFDNEAALPAVANTKHDGSVSQRTSWWSTDGPRPCCVGAAIYGVEIQDSTVRCIGVTVTKAAESAFNCYNNAKMIVERCNVNIADPGAVREGAPSGFKVWSAGTLEATDCAVSGVVFGFAAIGAQTSLRATRCRAENITNGFTIDAAKATLQACAVTSRHVCVFTLNKGRCTIEGGTFVSSVIGVESKGCAIELRRCSISGSSRSGVLGYQDAYIDAEDVTVGTSSSTATADGDEGEDAARQDASHPLVGSCLEVTASRVRLSRVALRGAAHAITADACPSIDVQGLSIHRCANGLNLKDVASASFSIALVHVHETVLKQTRSHVVLSACEKDSVAVVGCALLVEMEGGGTLGISNIKVALRRRQPKKSDDGTNKDEGLVIAVKSAEKFSLTDVVVVNGCALSIADEADNAVSSSNSMVLSRVDSVTIAKSHFTSVVCQATRCGSVVVDDASLLALEMTAVTRGMLASLQLLGRALPPSLVVSDCPSMKIEDSNIASCCVANSSVAAIWCVFGRKCPAGPTAPVGCSIDGPNEANVVAARIASGSHATLVDSVFWQGPQQRLLEIDGQTTCSIEGRTSVRTMGGAVDSVQPSFLVDGQSLLRVETVAMEGPLQLAIAARNQSVVASGALPDNVRLDLDTTSSQRNYRATEHRLALLKTFVAAGIVGLCGYLLRHL